jgi:7-carboxy-7-deazaguanine synthase
VRLTACDLRCSYCDTAYAFSEGRRMSLNDVVAEVQRLAGPFRIPHPAFRTPHSALRTRHSALRIPHSALRTPHSALPSPALPLVELTGGEPLLQRGVLPLMTQLCDDGFTVLLETSGAHDIKPVDPRVRRIMDLKCPGSGESGRNRWENLRHLKAGDELKFVISTREDYDWAREQIAARRLDSVCPVLMSWAHPLAPSQRDKSLKPLPRGTTPITREELADKIIADALPVRFQIQLHKVIWRPDQRGV